MSSPEHAPELDLATDDLFARLEHGELRAEGGGGFIGPYQVLGRLGQGAMGAVFRAQHVHPERQAEHVAVKLLDRQVCTDPLALKHARAEALALAQLDHPNVIRVFETGLHESQLYIVMELIDGPDVQSLLGALRLRGLTMPWPLACYLVERLLAALEYVHQVTDEAGTPLAIVHRDVCPSNLFVAADGGVRLGDFSISLVGGDKRDRKRAMQAGHLGYMALEQLEGDPADRRADLFAATAVLVALLTGHPPFDQDDIERTYQQVRKGQADLTGLPAGLPDGLAPLVARGLQPSAKKRFQSAAELRAALRELCGDQATEPRAALAGLLRALRDQEALPATARPSVRPNELILLSTDPDVEESYVELLADAGFEARVLENPDALGPATGLPLVVDLTGLDAARRQALNERRLRSVSVLAGALTEESLAAACELACHAVCFLPYDHEAVARVLNAEIIRLLNATRPPASGRRVQRGLAGRRLLLAGFPPERVERLRARLEAQQVVVDLAADLAQARALTQRRSHHLLALWVEQADRALLQALRGLRQGQGYHQLPFVVVVGEVGDGGYLLSQSLEELHWLHRDAAAQGLPPLLDELLGSSSLRVFERFACALPASYRYRGSGVPCTLRNASRLGALLAAGQLVPVGDTLTLRLQLPGQAQDIQAQARVARVEVGSDPARMECSLGVELIGLTASDEERWVRLIMSLASRAPGG